MMELARPVDYNTLVLLSVNIKVTRLYLNDLCLDRETVGRGRHVAVPLTLLVLEEARCYPGLLLDIRTLVAMVTGINNRRISSY